jgi:hypothetical protein
MTIDIQDRDTVALLKEVVDLAVSRLLNSDKVMKLLNEELSEHLTQAADEFHLAVDLNADANLVALFGVSLGERPYGKALFTVAGEVVK